MTNEQIFDLAGQAAPEVMEKTARALYLLEALDPDSVPEALHDMEVVASTAVNGMAKTAALSPIARDVSVAAVGGVLATLGTAVAMDLYDSAKRGLSKGVNFKRMMDTNPDLRNMDKGKVRSAFDAVHRFGGPEYTADPLAGGSMVKHLAELPDYSPDAVAKMVNARKAIVEARRAQMGSEPFRPAIETGIKAYESHLRNPPKTTT